MKIENTLWVEKHRPKKLDQLVLPDDYRIRFQQCIQAKDISNFLFSGPAGGGKTTVARILASKNGVLSNSSDNLLEVNGSAKETRGINYVNDVIEPYLKTPPLGSDKIKIVFIDECDQLTEASFKSLRGIIEKYSDHGRFLMTCNYLSKLPDAVQSRFQLYIFKRVSIEHINKYAEDILKKENIEYDIKDLKFLVSGLYPDIRRMVNALQMCATSGKLKVNKDIVLTNEKIIVTHITNIVSSIKNNEMHKINKSVTDIMGMVNEQDLEFRSIYVKLFDLKVIPVPAKIVINKYANLHGDCLVPSMHFMAMVFEVIKSLSTYKRISK